ncbi:ATP-binding protein [Verrucomicrobiota bacterium]
MGILGLTRGAVVNLFILLGFVALCGMMRGCCATHRRSVTPWHVGILFGCMAVVAMMVPAVTSPGMFFDCRSGVVGAAALLAGPVAALVALPLPCAYRLYIGGGGTLPGLLELILPALLGSLCYLWFKRRNERLTVRRVIASSLFAGLGTNAIIVSGLLVFMPEGLSQLGVMGAVLVTVNTPISMALLSSLILLERQHFEAVEELAEGERRMLHSQKMAAVGQLARKVAHSFANALTSIMGNAQLTKEEVDDDSPVKEFMEDTVAAAGRASRLTADLLAFSSPGSMNVRRMDLGKCILGVERMLGETLGPEIEIVIEADPDTARVEIDPDRIEQAVVHMAVNAAEAMAGHGRLTLTVANADLSESENRRLQAGVSERDRHKGAFVLLSISDTGCGMSGKTVARVFEPFFTTKERRDNAGLGLATVYNIVQRHNGCIDVRTAPGRGTTFLIYLPVAE